MRQYSTKLFKDAIWLPKKFSRCVLFEKQFKSSNKGLGEFLKKRLTIKLTYPLALEAIS
jgi:hypothetical protein